MNSEDFEELYGEPRMTMAQLLLEEQWAEEEFDREIIQEWRDLEIAGDPPPEVEDAIRREQLRLAQEETDV